MDIEIGDETFTKKPNVLEELAYRDTWGQGRGQLHCHDLRASHADAGSTSGGRQYLCAL